MNNKNCSSNCNVDFLHGHTSTTTSFCFSTHQALILETETVSKILDFYVVLTG
jgi:hypothetical protein